jgi:hypothetical protein
MSTPAQQPGTEHQPDDAETAPDPDLEGAQLDQDEAASSDKSADQDGADYSDQDSEPPLSAPNGPDGTVDAGGQDGQDGLPAGTHGSARRPPADS